ncbi:MAG: serine/threonine-protein kinase, partial [Planctomycetota bacterium]|nr:serine/threonine-protein kinase [Planctomycetota bacterium]
MQDLSSSNADGPDDEIQSTDKQSNSDSLDETLDLHGETDGGWAQADASDPEAWVGRTVARYKILRVLGVGGMGMVFEALDTTIQRNVALKILPNAVVETQLAQQRFLEEARAVGKLNHPHVVVLHEIGTDGDVHYIVMELVCNGTADDFRDEGEAMSVAMATHIARQAAMGLGAAHSAGIVHRDIKPANLLLGEGDQVKVTDFGLAKQVTNTELGITREGQIIGTPSYISPEQCESRPADFRSDVYSLGATYYKLLTGERPFADQTSAVAVMYAHCNAERPDPRRENPKVPAAAAAVVRRAMAKRPINRYESMAEMEAALGEVERELAGGPPAKG